MGRQTQTDDASEIASRFTRGDKLVLRLGYDDPVDCEFVVNSVLPNSGGIQVSDKMGPEFLMLDDPDTEAEDAVGRLRITGGTNVDVLKITDAVEVED